MTSNHEEKQTMLRGICADRYRPDKIPDNVDTVVIGSGMSGLTCAAVLICWIAWAGLSALTPNW